MLKLVMPFLVGLLAGLGGASAMVITRAKHAAAEQVAAAPAPGKASRDSAAPKAPADTQHAAPQDAPHDAPRQTPQPPAPAAAVAAPALPPAPAITRAAEPDAPAEEPHAAAAVPTAAAKPATRRATRDAGAAIVGKVGGQGSAEQRLAKVFASMPARDAARILEQMDDRDVRAILGHVADRQVAAIMASFPPARAAALGRAALRQPAAAGDGR
jgi:hypothetical protein